MNITPIDISVERETEIQTRKSAFDLYNVMSGQFLSPESNWNPESLNTIKVNADIAADGRTRQIANDFLQVTDSDTAQYLLNIRYRQQRKGGTATLPVSRRVGLNVMEGEWITYDGKTWMVSEWRIDDKFRFTLILTETGADIYAEGGIEPGPIVIPPTEPFNPSLLSTIQNFNVEVGMIFGADGYERPVLRFSWTPPEDPTVTAVRFFYKIANEMEIFEDQCTSPEDGTYITSKNVESGMFYEARATITTVPDRFKSYTPWKTTVTPTGMQSIAVYLKAVQEDMRDVLKTAWAEADRYRELFERISLDAAAGTGTNVVDRQVYTEKFTNTTAQIIEEKRIRADADGALAEVTTAISAQIDDPDSGLVANATGLQQITAEVRDDETGLSALALAMIGVEASVGDLSAGGLISFRAQVPPPAGVLSQISILARANTSSQFIQSGMVIQVYQEGAVLKSRILNIATQFVIWDGNAANLPFVFEDGILKLAGARLGTLYFDQLQSTNGKLIIRGSGNLADIRMFF
ncbi:hypothetical protein G3A39_42785 [Paraburkholderia aspalathi]|nr:hypothetical protein [Paraburkholderia aspalathi]